MRKTFLLILLVGVFAAGAAAQSGRRGMTPPPPPPPEKLSEPPIVLAERSAVLPLELAVLPESVLKRQLKALDNGTFSLADFSGKIVVVNLWATWCGPAAGKFLNTRRCAKSSPGVV